MLCPSLPWKRCEPCHLTLNGRVPSLPLFSDGHRFDDEGAAIVAVGLCEGVGPVGLICVEQFEVFCDAGVAARKALDQSSPSRRERL